MKLKKIAFITESRFVMENSEDWYTKQIIDDDQALIRLLPHEYSIQRVDWSDSEIDWSKFDLCIIRTTWDYFYKINSFRKWLDNVKKVTRVINTPSLIIWNMDKHYLFDLKIHGVRIVESTIVKNGTTCSLIQFMNRQNLENIVVKPTIAGGAKNTFKLNKVEAKSFQTKFDELIKDEDYIIQPFQRNIPLKGEVSIIIIGGVYTHAVLKKVKPGDFRVQDDYGGSVHSYKPSEKEINFALNVVSNCPEKPLYARVDFIEDNEGEIALLEVELIEPEMWFRKSNVASEKFVSEIVKILRLN